MEKSIAAFKLNINAIHKLIPLLIFALLCALFCNPVRLVYSITNKLAQTSAQRLTFFSRLPDNLFEAKHLTHLTKK